MSSEYLLDIDTAIHLFKQHPLVRRKEEEHGLRYLPFVTAVELLYGAKRSGRPQENLHLYSRLG